MAARAAGTSHRLTDRLVLGGALAGLAVSLGLYASALAGLDLGPPRPRSWWTSWALHLGAVLGFWHVAGRIAASGLRGVPGLLRIRRMVPIPLRLALGTATLNAGIAAGLTMAGRAAPDRAWSAYWCLMYLLVTVAGAFVLPRLQPAPTGSVG